MPVLGLVWIFALQSFEVGTDPSPLRTVTILETFHTKKECEIYASDYKPDHNKPSVFGCLLIQGT